MDNGNLFALLLAAVMLALTLSSLNSNTLRAAALHNASWSVALFIVGSGIIPYDAVSANAWLIIVASIVVFNVGVIGGSHLPPTPRVGLEASDTAVPPLVTLKVYSLLLVGFLVGFAVYVITVAEVFGLGVLLSDPASIRASRTVSYLETVPIYAKLLMYLGPLCFVLTVFPRFVTGLSGKSKSLRYSIALGVLAAQGALLQRTNVFVCLLWALALIAQNQYMRQRTPLKPRRLTRLLAVGLLGLVTFQGLAIALGKTGTENAAITSTIGRELAGNPASGVLIYVASGVVAFDKLVTSTNTKWPPSDVIGVVYGDFNPETNGKATAAAVVSRLPVEPTWNELSPYVQTPVPTNVYTWLEPWYRDFQVWGVLAGSLLIAVLIGGAMSRAERSPEALLFASLLVGFSGLAVFTNRYTSTMSLVLYLLLGWLGWRRRRSAARALSLGTDARRYTPAGVSADLEQRGTATTPSVSIPSRVEPHSRL